MLAGIRGRGAMPQPSVVAPHKKGSASGTSGAYTKLNLIGKGSFGAVYQVRHTQKGGETLVLKEVQTKGLASSEIRATKQEISVLKRVKHPHIIGYVNTFEENGVVSEGQVGEVLELLGSGEQVEVVLEGLGELLREDRKS